MTFNIYPSGEKFHVQINWKIRTKKSYREFLTAGPKPLICLYIINLPKGIQVDRLLRAQNIFFMPLTKFQNTNLRNMKLEERRNVAKQHYKPKEMHKLATKIISRDMLLF